MLASRRRAHRAVVLILTLLLVLVLVVVVGQLSYTTSIDRILADNQAGDLLVEAAISSGIQIAMALLVEDAKATDRKYDAGNEPWAAAWQKTVGEASVTGVLEDQEARWHLFWLLSESQADKEAAKGDLERLLTEVRGSTAPDGKTLAGAISGWVLEKKNLKEKITSELKGRTLGGKAPLYTLDDLLLVEGLDETVLYGTTSAAQQTGAGLDKETQEGNEKRALARHLTLWGKGLVNLNTATKEVFVALNTDLKTQQAEAIIARRRGTGQEGQVQAPFLKKEDLKEVEGFNVQGQDGKTLYQKVESKIAVESTVFRLDLTATWKSYTRRVWVVLRREGKSVTVLMVSPRD